MKKICYLLLLLSVLSACTSFVENTKDVNDIPISITGTPKITETTQTQSETTPTQKTETFRAIIHVSPDGDDSNPGTAEEPLATIERARDIIRKFNSDMQESIYVILHGGIYFVEQPIQFTEKDSGKNGFNIIFQAHENEEPIISGGIGVSGWEHVPETNLWKTTLPDANIFRQLYVNGKRAQRAVSQTQLTGTGWVPGEFSDRDGISITSSLIPNFSRPQDLELHWINDWKDMRLLVKDVEDNQNGVTTIWMRQPYYELALKMEQWIPKYNVPFYIENAFELLDEPGEWYFNQDTQDLYYWPQADETIENTNFIIPQSEILLEISGGGIGQEVHNLNFKGLTFQYGGWTRTSEIGTFGWQAQNLIIDHYGGQEMSLAHVQINSAHDINIEQCRFEDLGGVGLHLNNNVHEITVEGNLFSDISDAGIVIGHWDHNFIDQPDEKEPKYIRIANNLINNVGVEFWGAPAITAYYVNNVDIIHNEISNVPYTGISLGWGWSFHLESTTCHDNYVGANLITDASQIARDAGGIYTLGQQPGTLIEENVVRRMKNDYACLYTDEGSAYITLQNNVCDSAPQWMSAWINTIHDIEYLNNFANTLNMRNDGTNITIENTTYISGQSWPDEAQAIIENAGLEFPFMYLYDWLDD